MQNLKVFLVIDDKLWLKTLIHADGVFVKYFEVKINK